VNEEALAHWGLLREIKKKYFLYLFNDINCQLQSYATANEKFQLANI
jgi:hypothetical protein